jgi:hypothetical protein
MAESDMMPEYRTIQLSFERAAANTKLLILKQARWRSSHPLADLTDMPSIRRETRR